MTQRIVGWRRGDKPERLLTREWLVTNGLGGYASGSISGACTRRFHGLLIAALPAPLGRILFLNHLEERLTAGGLAMRLSGDEFAAGAVFPDVDYIEEFVLEDGLPVWRYRKDDLILEKTVFMAHLENTTYVRYRLLGGKQAAVLELRPYFQIRPHEGRVDGEPVNYEMRDAGTHYEVAYQTYPPFALRVLSAQATYTVEPHTLADVIYRVEQGRGYDYHGEITSPGYLRIPLAPGAAVTLRLSTEILDPKDEIAPDVILEAESARRQKLLAAADPSLREGDAAQLVFAADQFVILPQSRIADTVRARYEGGEARSVVAGYHWFTDWGRDTMISLEGLCLHTGRHTEAGYILRTFAHYVRDGLIPNLFPEGEKEGLYHTADATLWFFHAIDRYVKVTGDHDTLTDLLPTLESIIEHHLRGTDFGIHVDPEDGLLIQGAPRYQLTWMDAKVGDWVVTPRRGKAVEINALFYNALCLLGEWLGQVDEARAHVVTQHAQKLSDSFNKRFWNEAAGCLFDVVDGENGDDPAVRPNQVFAISLPHPVLAPERWRPVLDTVKDRLLTPVGLRSLAPGHPDYKSSYNGDLRARDAAYHQGTVWAWLIGPFVDAWLKVYPDKGAFVTDCIAGFFPQLSRAGVGGISEIFDAETPFRPRGCIAQAWSIAEVLRCYVLNANIKQPS